jgi:transcriptional regulator with XRE-family HTH domain
MSTREKSFESLSERAKERTEYWVEGAILDFTEDVCKRMEALGMTRAAFARRLNKSPAYITKVLRGNNNFTLQKMVEIADALRAEVRVHLQPQGARTTWLDVHDKLEIGKTSAWRTHQYAHGPWSLAGGNPDDSNIHRWGQRVLYE